MLNASKVLIFFSILITGILRPAAAGTVTILSPVEGDYLQGAVTVTGEMDLKGFRSYEVAFTYEDEREEPAWFLIKRDINQVLKGTLAVWDTTTITDGEYKLRVVVEMEDGQRIEKIVRHLHVSNYSPIAGAAAAQATLQPQQKTGLTSPAAEPVKMDLPANPAELTRDDLTASFSRGLLLALLVFAALGLYLAARRGLPHK